MPQRKIHALAGLLLGVASLPSLARADSLKVTTATLDNGLQVVLSEDHSVPLVNIEIWYHVGSKDEKKGRTGFAHLFEHLMFKGSANVKSEEHINFVQTIGGRSNAGTTFDYTMYYETVPSHYLERLLWMEADRLASLDISEANFHSERDVVKEERRQRVDNPPYGRLLEVVMSNSYTTHPYKILPIGSMADLDAATVEDVREFHSRFYVPNNATLVVTGDLDTAETLAWVKKYFGPLPKGQAIARNQPAEPAQTAQRRAVEYDPKAPLPAVFFTYHIPASTSPDLYPLRIASAVLSTGQSSRLYKSMVYDKQIAVFAGGQILDLEDPGIFFFYTILQAGQKPEDGEKAVAAEVARLQAEPITGAELDKAKNQAIAGLVFGRQTVDDKGEAIGDAALLGDPSRVNREVASYQKVTAADVQRVLKQYFRPENRTVVYMLPESMRPAAAGDTKGGKP